ncbi:MBL fold metallo-hydrolase [Massilia sp. W12]|uniref:MBL fold metallo-hydrolase n=1 Tax=Massilia sp. W12 TaxID=3126507 RepID=UPI0030D06B3B
MKFKFWGVRGSIPSPGPRTVRFGGNTTCIEVRTDAGELLILDAGTGIFQLAQSLPKSGVNAHIFISHSHWDHIHGLPFFTPLFFPGNRVRLHGGTDARTGSGIREVMQVQLQYAFFPVLESEMAAAIEYEPLRTGQRFQVNDACVRNVQMNHPVLNLGYRIDCQGKSLFFTGDHEPFYNLQAPGSPAWSKLEHENAARMAEILDCMRGVDALIVDCTYTEEEYQRDKLQWGHGTFDSAFAMAHAAGAKTLFCTHHEPTRSDEELCQAFDEACARNLPGMPGLQAVLAYEGLEVTL